MAGLVPGLLLAALFSLTVWGICVLRPEFGGEKVAHSEASRALLRSLLPMALLFFLCSSARSRRAARWAS